MAVLIEAISVVVRRDAIEARFPGGFKAFLASVPTAASCADDDLIRVGFMDSMDVRAYVELLEAAGLKFCHEEMAMDLAVVDQNEGPTTAAPWLKFGAVETDGMKLRVCWLVGTEPKEIAAPEGWKYEGSLSASGIHVKSHAVIGDRLKFLRRENGVEVYLDLQTNEEIYSARPQISGETPGALHTQISAIVHGALNIEAKGPIPRPRFWGKADPRFKRLEKDLLPAIDRIASGAGRDLMPAHFARGIVLRMLGRKADAEQAFRRANELMPGTTGVLRELVKCIGEQGRPREALTFAKEAVAVDPADASLLGNLAACLMQCGDYGESMRVIDQALEIEPSDEINLRIKAMVSKRLGK